ncbi:hypothetical protein [Myxococcus faecalis]|uniref:hypothetical protein n=1 Tax=Myxococcus faecalis TaxID=3115646 RepID=UPI003CFB0A05
MRSPPRSEPSARGFTAAAVLYVLVKSGRSVAMDVAKAPRMYESPEDVAVTLMDVAPPET